MIRFLAMITLLLPLAGMADRQDDAVSNSNRPDADLAPEIRGKPTDRFFHIYQR